MKKIPTLFKKDPNNLGLVIIEIDPQNQWVLEGQAIPYRKFDGTACAIIDGVLYKRYDAKKGKEIPADAIPCQEADPITGHHPHWIKCDINKKADKYHFLAFSRLNKVEDGTYELVGPKINGNNENANIHILLSHKCYILSSLRKYTGESVSWYFEYLKNYLTSEYNDIEGIVFHHKTDGRMCKLRKSDFGIKRIKY